MCRIHPSEPGLSELKEIRAKLYGNPSTNENMKKLCAIEAQIARREACGDKSE